MSVGAWGSLAVLVAVLTVFTGWFFRRRFERRLPEASKMESEESFRLMIQSIKDYAIIMLNPDGQIMSWNAGAERFKGYKADEIIGKHFSRFYPEEDVKSGKPEMELKVAAREGRFEDEGWRVRKDGSLFWANVVITVLREKSGKLRGYAKVTRDLTKRKQAERELQWKTALFEAQVNSSIDGIMVIDENNKKIIQNRRVDELWKIPREISENPDAQQQLEWVAKKVKNATQFLKGVQHRKAHPQEIVRSEVELKDGTILDRYSAPVIGKNGDHYGRITTFRDITERKRATEQLDRLFELSTDMIFTAGFDGYFKRVNPACEKILGYSSQELLAMPFMKLAHPEEVAAMTEAMTRAIAGASIMGFESRLLCKDGSSKWIQVNSVSVAHEQMFYVIGRDITELKRMGTRLLQSQKMETVGKLAGGIAHEFNSILTAIIGQSELLLQDLSPESPLANNATEIRQAADRAASLTRQLLAYGRKQILQPEILDLNLVLVAMESTLNHLLGNACVRIVPGTGLKAVKIDPGQMEQVIVNITMNAATAMPNGGNFILETCNTSLDEDFVRPFSGLVPGDYVLLTISDTGTGMNEETKAHAFEPFSSIKGVGQGTGLGLATCYGILKQSGGHISVYSELGRGSTFKIYLPQFEPQKKTNVPRAVAIALPGGTETILLAEDDPALLGMSAALLRKLGYNVLTAANGIEALGLGHQRDIGHIDLLFTDVIMPHMSGKELSERIHAIFPHTKILFTSAYTENAIVHQGILNEGVMLLQKPFTPSGLAHKIREILDR